MKKDSKYKDYYNKFKTAWKNPRKRAGIKLLSYLVFFIVFLLLAAIISRIDTNYKDYKTNNTTEVKNEVKDNYKDKKDNFFNTKHSINYDITINENNYKIDGNLDNNTITGYLETTDIIKKIVVENNILYEIKNNEKEQTDNEIDFNLISLTNISNLVETNTFILETTNDSKNYIYKINKEETEINLKIYTNDTSIYKIEVNKNQDNYILDFDKE